MKETFKSDISGKEHPVSERVSAKTIHHSVLDLITRENPHVTHDSYISTGELAHYRSKKLKELLFQKKGKFTEPEQTVLNSIENNTILSEDKDSETELNFGQRLADKVAAFGGSWTFIISFGVFILIWIAFNVFFLLNKGFDPYPFILLNLILSCIASVQAPLIMMSQNRQEEKDRERAKKDYMINLKAEIEIRSLQEKLDHFILDMQQELLELQKTQLSLMNEIKESIQNLPK